MPKRNSKPFVLTQWHLDVLKAIFSIDGQSCDVETVRRKMYGIYYPNYQIDLLRFFIEFSNLEKFGFIEKIRNSTKITEKGYLAIYP